MTTLLTSRRSVGWVRSVLLIATLVVAVLIHHGVEHSMTGKAAMPGMAASTTQTIDQPMTASPAAHQQMPGVVVEASSSDPGCTGDQMCQAAGIAKTPSTAHPAIATSGVPTAQPRLAVGAVRCEPVVTSPPPTSAVLRI